MKKYHFFIALIAVCLLMACKKEKENIVIENITFTECLTDIQKSQSEDIIIEYKDGYIYVTHKNAMVNCGFTRVDVTFTIENNTIIITEQEDKTDANCMCPTDISYRIGPVESGEYAIIIKLQDQIVYNGNTQSACDQDVIISQEEYETAPNDPITIIDMEITGNCLKIKFGASGCSGDSWVVKLIDEGSIAYTNPSTRVLRLSLENPECCLAYFTREISFNIEDLQIAGDNSVWLNISGQSILYEY